MIFRPIWCGAKDPFFKLFLSTSINKKNLKNPNGLSTLMKKILLYFAIFFKMDLNRFHFTPLTIYDTFHFINAMDLKNTNIPVNKEKILPLRMKDIQYFSTFSYIIIVKVRNAQGSTLGEILAIVIVLTPQQFRDRSLAEQQASDSDRGWKHQP